MQPSSPGMVISISSKGRRRQSSLMTPHISAIKAFGPHRHHSTPTSEIPKTRLCTSPRQATRCVFIFILRSIKEPACRSQAGTPSRDSPGLNLAVTAVYSVVCKHGFFLPNSTVDFDKGERLVLTYFLIFLCFMSSGTTTLMELLQLL